MLVAKNNSFVIRMKRFAAILFLTFVLIELMAVTPAGAWFRVEALPVHDSVEFRVKKDEGKAVRGRMSHSAYPVVFADHNAPGHRDTVHPIDRL